MISVRGYSYLGINIVEPKIGVTTLLLVTFVKKKHVFMISFLPRPIRLWLTSIAKLLVVKYVKTSTDSSIPKVDVSTDLIENTKVLSNRFELLKLLPKNGVGAELGVNRGEFSQEILNLNNPKKLHLVDVWGSKRYNQEIRKEVETKFYKQIEDGLVEVNLGFSTIVVDQFDEEYFDWIYIDTDHSYKTTKRELELYHSKMKRGGIIAGHDYTICNWDGVVRYGVIEAVHEFCLKNDWEILYITMEMTVKPSFAIRKIN